MEDHIGHKRKLIKTVYKEDKQEVSTFIDIIDEKIREFKDKQKCMKTMIEEIDTDEEFELEYIIDFAKSLENVVRNKNNQLKLKIKEWTDNHLTLPIDEMKKFKASFESMPMISFVN